MSLLCVGLSHHQAPIEVRERLALAERDLPHALVSFASLPNVREAAVLSTCNRLEIYALADGDTREALAALSTELGRLRGTPAPVYEEYLFRLQDPEAVAHLMRVASGLDSQIRGESQILGQVRTALRVAREAGTLGPAVGELIQRAILAGKRVHTETTLGRGAFSIGHAAVDLAATIFADLGRATVLLLGAGKMSELTARHLIESGVQLVIVANRTFERAEAMARRLGGSAIRYDDFPDALVRADIVISSTAAPHPIILRDSLAPIVRRRRGRPLFLIDIAVPRDVEPAVAELGDVFLYNIDDLQACVAQDARQREEEVARAEAIAAEEAASYLAWYRMRDAAPVITDLRNRLEQIRRADLNELRSRLPGLTEREWQAIETATRAMMNRVAREPILRLKQATLSEAGATEPAQYDLLAATREIFGLFEAEREEPESEVVS